MSPRMCYRHQSEARDCTLGTPHTGRTNDDDDAEVVVVDNRDDDEDDLPRHDVVRPYAYDDNNPDMVALDLYYYRR